MDMVLMHIRQLSFSKGPPNFVYLSADSSPQGSLEFFVVLEDRVSRASAGEIVEASPEERASWCNSGCLSTTTLPISILGSGNASAASKGEALAHAVILDCMWEGDPSLVARYGASIISYCSDFGAEANIANLPHVCVQDMLKNNVANSGGLLVLKKQVAERCLVPMQTGDGEIVEDVILVDDIVAHDPPPVSEQPSFFGLRSSLMIPGVKHMFDNENKDLLAALQHYPTYSDTQQMWCDVIVCLVCSIVWVCRAVCFHHN